MIEVTEPPERLIRISRKGADQTRLFDTQEMEQLSEDEVSEDQKV
jgi:hypothetical protein